MEQKEGRFIPVQGKITSAILTFIYLFFLAALLIFLQYFINNPYNLGTSFLLFMSGFFEGGLLLVLVAPLVLTVVIYKSFLKGLLTLAGLVFLFLFIMFLLVTSEEFGYLEIAKRDPEKKSFILSKKPLPP